MMATALPLVIAHPDQQLQTPPLYKWRLLFILRRHSIFWLPSTPTLQGTLEQALTRVTKLERKDLCVVSASRTDTGVHA
ncbi:putative pseudouridine synthase, catalytic domain superfamily [Helianthus anomalus]